MNPIKKTFTLGSQQVTLETGEIARQAHGAVICTVEDTMVLATVVAAKEPRVGQDWFPLTVDYVEKTYAAGKIPGGFFKREGRPSEKETLTSRLIDRPIRPLFPDGFYNEVQVVATVLSLNPEVESDIPAMLAVSAALICYAVAAPDTVTLFVSGLVLAASLWWGPGGSRLRSPLNRLVVPVSRSMGLWVAAVVLRLGLAAALGLVAADAGVRWWPDEGQPFRDVSL